MARRRRHRLYQTKRAYAHGAFSSPYGYAKNPETNQYDELVKLEDGIFVIYLGAMKGNRARVVCEKGLLAVDDRFITRSVKYNDNSS